MEDLKSKDRTIQFIYAQIVEKFGMDFFDLVDFWEADSFAIGIRNKEKLVYLSTWDYKENPSARFRCYAEFEIISLSH
jgi:hypothetical protein